MQVCYSELLRTLDLLRDDVTEERTERIFVREMNGENLSADEYNAYNEIYRSISLVRDLALQSDEKWTIEHKEDNKYSFSFVNDRGRICEGVR